jgi:CRISPR-associated endonuclease/helicase Cas3
MRISECSCDFPSYSVVDLRKVLKVSSVFHDFGKATPWFQKYITNLGEKYTANERNLRQHGLISAFMTFGILAEIAPNNLFLPAVGFLIVRRHHGDLESYQNLLTITDDEYATCDHQADHIHFEEYQEIVKEYGFTDYVRMDFLKTVIYEVKTGKFRRFREVKRLDRKFTIEHYFIVNLLYSLLTNADKSDAIFHSNVVLDAPVLASKEVNDFRSTLKDDQGRKINNIRDTIFQNINNAIDTCDESQRVFSINAPTGSGKTIAALFAALKIREKFGLSHMIYCLPFTSIIDQNFEVFDKIRDFAQLPNESNILLKHHHLAEIRYRHRNNAESEIVYLPNQALHLIEGWESQLVVTTFVQFLLSLISNGNASLRKFHRFSNSVIILDEVQTIPHDYWSLVKTALQNTAVLLNSRIIFVTATMPLIFSEIKNEIKELVTGKEELFKNLSRIEIDLSHLSPEEIEWDTFCNWVETVLRNNPGKDILVILNTIRSARELYQYCSNLDIPHHIEYLSSHVVPKERLRRIKSIAHQSRKTPTLVISTQLVEAGVDIDLDIVIRDFAPLDSIFQTCGRCNRECRQGIIGKVFLVSIKDSKGWKPSQIYDRFLIEKTKKVLSNKNIIKESIFYDLAKEYYHEVAVDGAQQLSSDILNAMSLLEYTDKNGRPFSDKFELINQDYSQSVFIEMDKKAEQAWLAYASLTIKEKNFENNAYLKKARRNLAGYIINVPKKCLSSDSEYGIYHLKRSHVCQFYDPITGFNPDCEIPEENSTLSF